MKTLVVALTLLICTNIFSSGYAQTDQGRLATTFQFEIPNGWEVQERDGVGYYFDTDESVIRLRHYDLSDFEYFGVEAGNLEGLVEWLVTEAFEERGFNGDAISEMTFGPDAGISYVFEDQEDGETFMRQILLKPLTSGGAVAANIRPRSGMELNEVDVTDVIQTMSSVEQTSEIQFYEGTSLKFPEDWTVQYDYNRDFARVILADDELVADVMLWPGWGGISGLETSSEFFAHIYIETYGEVEPLNRNEFRDIDVAGYEAVFDPVSTGVRNAEGLFPRGYVAVTLPNNTALTVDVYSLDEDASLDPVYDFLDTLNAGRLYVCPVWPDPGTRIRSEPSTSADVVRETTEDDFALVASEAVYDSDGFRWFHVDEGYIRSDIIWHEQSACSSIRGY